MLHTLFRNEPLRTEDLAPVRSWLETHYSRNDGWRLLNLYNWTRRCHDFVLQNDRAPGQPQRIIVNVNLDTTVTQRYCDQLKEQLIRMSQGAGIILKKILVINDDAAGQIMPAGVELVTIGELLNSKNRAAEPKLVA